LIEIRSPCRWQSYDLGATSLGRWTGKELLDAFRNLVEMAQNFAKICFFIDGLDEFEGDDTARTEIIDLLKENSNSLNINVCLLSRPWLNFKDAFENGPLLLLQNLTYKDIKNYFQVELGDNPRFERLKLTNSPGWSELILKLVEKDAGVFLWVHLVVQIFVARPSK